MRRLVATALLFAMRTAGGASPPPDDDSAALALQPSATPAPVRSNALAAALEFDWTAAAQPGAATEEAQRLSLDLRYDGRLLPTLRAVAADHLDLDRVSAPARTAAINTFKEAYLSWQPASNVLLDGGRINVREGVAYGYNPTDTFRANSLRSVDSLDPNSLRDTRLGTVMLRTQTLWDTGAVTALYAPRLGDDDQGTAAGPFSADWAATNSRSQWLVSASQRVTAVLTPQWLVYGGSNEDPQAGLNVTALLGTATVLYLEATGGRSPTLWAEAQGRTLARSWHAQAAAGFTYSTTHKLSLTLEYEFDGAALGAAGWEAARRGDPAAYGRYRTFAAAQQELATRQAAFAYVSWNDVVVRHLDAAAFIRVDLLDGSRLPWFELRYHWRHLDAAMRWQDSLGGPTTDYGAVPTRQTWQVLLDYYL